MAMIKYWGDEKHEDAIYAVYLKKVRYVPPPGFDGVPRYRTIDPDRPHLQCSCPGSDHLQWESVKERVIKAGTVEKLIECLVGPDGTMDSRHFNVFFATYRAFADPTNVLDRLLRRYESLEDEVNSSTSALVIQNSIRSILISWLDMYPEDFYGPSSDFAMLTNLLDFGLRCKLSDLRAKSRKLLERFKHIQEEGGMIAALPSLDHLAYTFGYDVMESTKNIQERVKMFDVGSENCVQIAEQLTFWDAELFRELIIHQCQGCVWSKRHRLSNDKVYTVKATIDQFNAVSQRVMTSIVLPDCRSDYRAKIIAKWIDIARELRALKNFSSLKAVLSSLQSEPVHRLKSSWALVPSRSMAQFRDLSAIYDMDEEGDERNARRILEQEGTAKCSPLRRPQLVQNCRRTRSDVNLAECQEGLINFEKRRKEFEVLAKLRLFQSAARAYNIPMDRVFCAWFYFLPCLSEKECFNRSLEVEQPPMISTPDMNAHHSTSFSNGNLNGTPKSSTLSRLFNSSRPNDDCGVSVSQPSSSSFSFSPSFYIDPVHKSEVPTVGACVTSENSTSVEEWIDGQVDGGPPGPISLSRTFARAGTGVQSFTAPSTPASSMSLKGGRTILYQQRIGCEFSPQDVFPHKRAYSGDSTQELETSISASIPDYTGKNGNIMRVCCEEARMDFEGMACCSVSASDQYRRGFHQSDASSCSSSSYQSSGPQGESNPFHLARVGLDDDNQASSGCANYKCIKVKNSDRMSELVTRALEKHLLDCREDEYCLVQLLPNGDEFQLPDKCNPYYAVAPDSSSPMLNLLLRKRKDTSKGDSTSPQVGPLTKKLNRMKRSNLLRWSSGFL
ncbi:RasGEF domain protein [Dictyocaulus viviparus]|uniref:RasGEF domain protein n=1 Tax=Dictyocaulus viviparus TaxID=29172 RepID=A0A0D8XYG4_DICVI|nr:RasGEF domain protein [Dictyocaulus viviparus]